MAYALQRFVHTAVMSDTIRAGKIGDEDSAAEIIESSSASESSPRDARWCTRISCLQIRPDTAAITHAYL